MSANAFAAPEAVSLSSEQARGERRRRFADARILSRGRRIDPFRPARCGASI